MWFGKTMRRTVPLCAAAMLLAGCGGTAPAAAPSSSSAAPASAAAKPAVSPAGSAAKPSSASSSAAKPSGATGSGAASGGKIALQSAYTTTSGTTIPVWVGLEGGDYANNGLDVTLSRIAPGAPIMAAIASGDVPITEAGGQEIVNAEVQGSDVVIVGGFGDKPTNAIVTVDSIKTPAELKGKTIGVSGIGAVSHVAGLLAVEKLGLKGQVNFLATGGLPQTLAAIQSGKVDGGMLSPPQTFEAGKYGLHVLVDVAKLGVVSQNAVVVTTHKYAKEHPDIVERFLKARIEGTHRAYTDKALAVKTIIKYAQIKDENLAGQTYDYFKDGEIWGKDGFTSEAGLQVNLDVSAQTNPKAKNFKPAQLVDLSFVQNLKASGLIDKLYGKPA